ncbi:MAG TPA: bifunctional hydroxymethylpyrimidine kinase/phosphomethylpyrimidine kinase, partial [Pyrinomonadaceae bacterium]|nr:bifunctional hydroxymethylpyrimidine kinase/phosphomethylpyrimidine kinase [Pyrinomonadaceae bacterium]
SLTPPLTPPRLRGGEFQPVVLTIAGFDPSGGAGIIADIRTIESFGGTAVAAITSVTFQNAEKFSGANHQSAESVRGQVEAILDATKIAALKIGMLPTAEVVREVTRLIRENDLPAPVIDPVMESTSGGKLMEEDAFEVFVTELLPLARVVSPNIPEAEKLAGMNIRNEDEMRQAAARIRELGVRAVLVKGGHLDKGSVVSGQWPEGSNREAIDLLDDDGQVTVFRSEWIKALSVRGTGCMLSSAIGASLAKGSDLKEAVGAAKNFVTDQLHNSKLKTEN